MVGNATLTLPWSTTDANIPTANAPNTQYLKSGLRDKAVSLPCVGPFNAELGLVDDMAVRLLQFQMLCHIALVVLGLACCIIWFPI